MILKALKHIVTLLLVLLACATLYSAWSVRMPPSELGAQCLCWFAFPYMWLALLASAIITFAFRSWFQFLCCVAACAASWGSAGRVIDIPHGGDGELPEGGSFKLLTYNIHYMNYASEMTAGHVRDSICGFLLSSDADIICLQEAPPLSAMVWWPQAGQPIKRLLETYPHIVSSGKDGGGQAILSKKPLRKAELDGMGKGYERSIIAADIYAGDDTVRIVNCHLASLALSGEQIDAVSSDRTMDENRLTTLRKAYDKMSIAFAAREKEAEKIAESLPLTHNETIVCGDFNDTPISYTYRTITCGRKPLTDARNPRRVGLARTYRGNLPPLRIDYILASGGLTTAEYAEHDMPMSDHKALSASFATRR